MRPRGTRACIALLQDSDVSLYQNATCPRFTACTLLSSPILDSTLLAHVLSVLLKSLAAKMSVIILGATGNVGRHIVQALLDLGGSLVTQIVACTRQPLSGPAMALKVAANSSRTRLCLAKVDMMTSDVDSLAAILSAHEVVVLVMAQGLSPEEMVGCQKEVAEALSRGMDKQEKQPSGNPPLLVKLSSYGIDGPLSQGPLGDAHRRGEDLFLSKNLPFVSLRPTSFFSNFEAYDWPSLRAGGRVIRSPLGPHARVNWVACQDIGRVAAAVIQEHLETLGNGRQASIPVFRKVDVVGPEGNTLSAPEVCRVVGECLKKEGTGPGDVEREVRYEETPLPTTEAYRGLWTFLRAGGFDVADGPGSESGRLLGGKAMTGFRDYIEGLVEGMGEAETRGLPLN